MKKITIEREKLLAYLRRAKNVLSNLPLMPVLAEMKIEISGAQAIFTTTDLDVTLICTIPCVNEENAVLTILLPVQFMYQIVDLMECPVVSIETDEKQAIIKGHNDVYELNSLLKPLDFPKLPEQPDGAEVVLTAEMIKSIDAAFRTVGHDLSRPAMTRVCIDIHPNELSVVSTNSHVLYKSSFPVETEMQEQVLISNKALKAIAGCTEITLKQNDNHFVILSDLGTVICKRLENKYPPYSSIIPDIEANLLVDRKELKAAIAKVALGSQKVTNAITLWLKNQIGFILIKSSDETLGRGVEVKVSGDYSGDVERVSFNHSMLNDLLSQIDYEAVNLSIVSDHKAALIKAVDDTGYLGLIMPLMLEKR